MTSRLYVFVMVTRTLLTMSSLTCHISVHKPSRLVICSASIVIPILPRINNSRCSWLGQSMCLGLLEFACFMFHNCPLRSNTATKPIPKLGTARCRRHQTAPPPDNLLCARRLNSGYGNKDSSQTTTHCNGRETPSHRPGLPLLLDSDYYSA